MGAGATGVELAMLAGAIGEIAGQTPKNDFRSIHPQEAQIILLDGAPRLHASVGGARFSFRPVLSCGMISRRGVS